MSNNDDGYSTEERVSALQSAGQDHKGIYINRWMYVVSDFGAMVLVFRSQNGVSIVWSESEAVWNEYYGGITFIYNSKHQCK